MEVVDLNTIRPNMHPKTLSKIHELLQNQLTVPILFEYREAEVPPVDYMVTSPRKLNT
jgi:hypothetical protein